MKTIEHLTNLAQHNQDAAGLWLYVFFVIARAFNLYGRKN